MTQTSPGPEGEWEGSLYTAWSPGPAPRASSFFHKPSSFRCVCWTDTYVGCVCWNVVLMGLLELDRPAWALGPGFRVNLEQVQPLSLTLFHLLCPPGTAEWSSLIPCSPWLMKLREDRGDLESPSLDLSHSPGACVSLSALGGPHHSHPCRSTPSLHEDAFCTTPLRHHLPLLVFLLSLPTSQSLW